MYFTEIPEDVKTTTPIQIRYDCCGKEQTLKHKDAKKNFEKNNGKHICRPCWLQSNNPAKRKEVQEKMKQTNLERYGATTALNSKENIAARVEQMFGTEEAVKEIVKKRRITNRSKYGSDHPMQNEQIKAKQQAVLIEKYGTHVPLQNEEVKAKMQKTVQDRYGVTNVAKLPEVRAKMAKTMFENYGVEYYNQLPEMKDYLRNNCPQWLKESWESGGPMKGITRPEEWNEKERETVLNLMAEGKWKGGPKNTLKGWYTSVKCTKPRPMFRSSYELKTHWHLDNDDQVDWYDYEPFYIPYYDTEGKKRRYIIDYVVKYKSGNLLAIEVKNNYTQGGEATIRKLEAFLEYCGSLLKHEFWSCDRIKSLGLQTERLLESDRVELY